QDAHARVDEVRLPLVLAAAQRRQERAALDQRDAAAGELDAEAVEETESAAGEVRVVEDGVEAVRVAVTRMPVAGGVEEAEARAVPIAIDGELERGHAGADAHGVAVAQFRIGAGDGVERVAPGHDV